MNKSANTKTRMQSNLKIRKGLTLVEVIIVVTFLVIVISLSSVMITSSFTSQRTSYNEYDVQNSIRVATTFTDRTIREASAIFTIPENRFLDTNLTEGWNYFGISHDKTEIVKYIYETRGGVTKHYKEVIVPKKEGITYSMNFTPAKNGDKEFIRYSIKTLKNGVELKDASVETELEAKNALQVVFRGTLTSGATAISWRSDERPSGGTDAIASIIIVVDVSDSMLNDLDGTESVPVTQRRITKVKSTLKNMVQEFSKSENLEVCFILFSTTANYPNPSNYKNPPSSGEWPSYNLSKPEDKTNALAYIDTITASGATNTGDALRRAYYKNDEIFNKLKLKHGTDDVKKYMILLTDGATTMASYATRTSFISGNGNTPPMKLAGQVRSMGTYTWKGYRTNIIYNVFRKDLGNVGYIRDFPSWNRSIDDYTRDYAELIAGDGVQSHIIHFSKKSTESDCFEQIGDWLNVDHNSRYDFATDGSLDLDSVFKQIQKTILTELWHIRGPKI